jgi:hypothetical protein
MKMLLKSTIVLSMLSICMPVKGEILIYKNTVRCLTASENDELWDVDEEIERGFLILDVTYDPNGAVSGISDVEQIRYVKTGRYKWYWEQEHRFEFAGIEIEKGVLWILMERDMGEGSGEILIITGKAKDKRIGLDRNERREVARAFRGEILADWIISDGIVQMCTVSLRLQSSFTKRANDVDEGNQDFEYAVSNIVKEYLRGRGYYEYLM